MNAEQRPKLNAEQILAIAKLIEAIATVSGEAWAAIARLLSLGDADASQIRQALLLDRPQLDALIAHLQERVPEDAPLEPDV